MMLVYIPKDVPWAQNARERSLAEGFAFCNPSLSKPSPVGSRRRRKARNTMKKRFLSALLLLALALSLLPTTALAANKTTATAATLDELKAALADPNVETIRFTDNIWVGKPYDEHPTEEDNTLTISRDVTFDLNEYGLGYGSSSSKVVITEDGTLRIAPRKNGGYPVVNVFIENHGKLYGGDAIFEEPVTCYDGAAIYSGTFVGDDVQVSFSEDGTAHIYGGTFGRVYDVGKIILHDGYFYAIEIPETKDAIYNSIKGGTFLEQFYGELLRNAGCKTGTVTFKISDSEEDTYCVVGGKPIAFQEYSTIDTGFIRNNDKYVTAWKYEDTNKRFKFSTPIIKDITLVPASWEPYITYGIAVSKSTVFGEQILWVTSRNYKDVFEDGTVFYNPETNVLTLKNAHLMGLSATTLTLRLVGENSIIYNPIGAYYNKTAIYATDLTVTGTGSLNIAPGVINGSQYLDGIRIFSGGSYTQESGTVTISGNHAGIADNPDWDDEESANFALHFNGGTLICNLIEPVVESGFGAAGALNGIVNLDVAEGGKLTLTYDFKDETQKELTGPLTEEQKTEIQTELDTYKHVTQMKFEREVEVPDEPEEPEIPEQPPIGPILAGGIVLAGDSNSFRDVRAIDWFYDDVMYAYQKGLMSGTAQDKFSPQASFTRGMLLTILARHDGVNTKGTPWYQAGCDWAVRTGVSDGRNPEEAISREEFAQILYRYAQYRGSHALAGNDLSGFSDAADISADALEAMQWAVATTIIRGDNFRLNPQAGATRAEACAMLHRFFAN